MLPARVVLALLAGALAVLAPAAPAAAHSADAPDGSDYRARVTGIAPAVAGLTVRVIEAGARLELVNHTGRPIRVLGYDGEPYLEVRPDGVHENVNSPATYRNRTLHGDGTPPVAADPSAAPNWRRVTGGPVARWHDQRIRWTGEELPPQVVADPGREHRVRDWTVPLRDGATARDVRGTLDWEPPPDQLAWWAGALAGLLLIGGLGLLPFTAPGGVGRVGLPATVVLAGLSAAAGIGAVAYAVARQLDSGSTGVGGFLLGLLGTGVWTLLTGLGAVAAGGYALARRPAGDFALALAGACLAIFAGLANVGVLTRAVPPVVWPPVVARTVVAAVIAIGLGTMLAGVLRMRALSRTVSGTVSRRSPAAQRGGAAQTGGGAAQTGGGAAS